MAALLAGVMTYFFSKRMRLSRAQHATSRIVAAVNDMPSGATLTAKDVALVDWPSNMLLAGSFDKVEDVVGKPLLYPLVASEPILKRELGHWKAPASAFRGKSPRACAPRRSGPMRSSAWPASCIPGSRVDVMVTYTPPGTGGSARAPSPRRSCRMWKS